MVRYASKLNDQEKKDFRAFVAELLNFAVDEGCLSLCLRNAQVNRPKDQSDYEYFFDLFEREYGKEDLPL